MPFRQLQLLVVPDVAVAYRPPAHAAHRAASHLKRRPDHQLMPSTGRAAKAMRRAMTDSPAGDQRPRPYAEEASPARKASAAALRGERHRRRARPAPTAPSVLVLRGSAGTRSQRPRPARRASLWRARTRLRVREASASRPPLCLVRPLAAHGSPMPALAPPPVCRPWPSRPRHSTTRRRP